MIAYITGSGFYEMPGFDEIKVTTRFGDVTVLRGTNSNGDPTLLVPRHGRGHTHLPHQINHRAHLVALAHCGASAVVSLSVCGILDPKLPLARPVIADDIYFPDNRLGDGSACTLFTEPGGKGRGHLLAGSLLHSELSQAIQSQLSRSGTPPSKATYAHVTGPRFNSKVEIRALITSGAGMLSQTCGPEAVLANELELLYALVAFGVDYANGVKESPTPVAELQDNLTRAKDCFAGLINELPYPAQPWQFENFVYRFDS